MDQNKTRVSWTCVISILLQNLNQIVRMLHVVKHVLPLPWYLKLRTKKHINELFGGIGNCKSYSWSKNMQKIPHYL